MSSDIGWLSGSCGTDTAFLGAHELDATVPASIELDTIETCLGRHLPQRPSWDCACGSLWPCSVARVGLSIGCDKAQLGEVMGGLLQLAAGEIRAEPGYLFERFLAWTQR